MSDLRATAAFFRCSLNQAMRYSTDMDVMRFVVEWNADPLRDRWGGW